MSKVRKFRWNKESVSYKWPCGGGVSFGLMQCSLARLSFSVLWVLSTTAWLVGYVKGMAYPPGSEELVELLGTIIRAIISLYGPRHPHD